MKTVVIGLLGTTLDRRTGSARWNDWRPTVDLCRHEDLVVDRFELIHGKRDLTLATQVQADIQRVSPETKVQLQPVEFRQPWDFEDVYETLRTFADRYPFQPEKERYLIHVTTGTHVMQICLFLLTETRYLPGQLIQVSPPASGTRGQPGSYSIIDLDLSRYDRIASRARKEQAEGASFLKSGIATRNAAFNTLIARIEQVAIASRAPLLLSGPTGAGKSQLARKIFELKAARKQVAGRFVEVNCATLRGDGAMSTLFGHQKGAFTGAMKDRPGLLREADRGMLFLDEIGELGADEQAMLLRAIEEKEFYPLGADVPTRSDFQLIAGTNRHLRAAVESGRFREDLLARIDVWSFRLPALRERPEDLEPNLDYELQRWSEQHREQVAFSKEARAAFLAFAREPGSLWRGNFRDFNAALMRMATLAPGGRITEALVQEEARRLQESWAGTSPGPDALGELLPGGGAMLDRFDQVQLAEVVRVCQTSESLSAAGRQLFAVSRAKKTSHNDADRLKKYLARFGLDWESVRSLKSATSGG